MIHKYIDVKLEDGSYTTIDISKVEQMFLDKKTGDILVWFKEKGKMVCALAVYWGI